MKSGDLAGLVQRFFTDRLSAQMNASPNTIASYRDAFRMMVRFASERCGRAPTALALADIDAELVAAFLTHLEEERGCSARSRNARLAAIRSFFRYVALESPEHLLHCQRVLALPGKRHGERPVAFLEPEEAAAIVDAPDVGTWIGRRNRAILLLMIETGLRVSELTGLTIADVQLGTGAHVRCEGKGRKRRATPIRREVAAVIDAWIAEERPRSTDPLFRTATGGRLSRDAVERLVRKHADTAAARCPTLRTKTVTPHVLRHTTAMTLLVNGVDQVVIALWLGHESMATTQVYVHADMRMKERALARLPTTGVEPARFRPDDALLSFLEGL